MKVDPETGADEENGNIVSIPCGACNKVFHNASTLLVHCEKHMEGKGTGTRYCIFCTYTGSRTAMLQHLRAKHTREELFKCSSCETRFATFKMLKSHVKNIHGHTISEECVANAICLSCGMKGHTRKDCIVKLEERNIKKENTKEENIKEENDEKKDVPVSDKMVEAIITEYVEPEIKYEKEVFFKEEDLVKCEPNTEPTVDKENCLFLDTHRFKSPRDSGIGDWLSMYPHHNQKSAGGPGPAAVAGEENAFPCPRCTRHHPGGCKSIDKLCRKCRKCNNIGHFAEVHDITNPKYRQLITNKLGINLWPDWDPQPSKMDSEALTPSRGKRPIVDEYGYEPESKRGRADPVHPAIGEVGLGDSPSLPPPSGNPPSPEGNNRRVSLEKLTEMERRLGLDRVSPPDTTRTDIRGPPGPRFQGGFQRQGGYDDYDRGGYGGNRGYGGGEQNH